MFDDSLVNISRLQFAMTALYHFLFVPLTLGLAVLLAIMETVYVMTERPIWKTMVQYWGVLFGINFIMGVSTGITMEFQFGTNWAYYSHFVGDIFGVPLAIEGMMAFFLEATFVGLFFFGWNKLSRIQHWLCTCLLALGTNLSALWILIANAWMQNPVGSAFNFETMRMEVTHFSKVLFNPVAQAKFVHTISAGYVTGALFVLSISAYFLLRGRNLELAKRSFTVAASFGLASALSVVVLGDESGYLANQHQHMKIAAMEAMWHTEKAPAPLTLFGIPDQDNQITHYAVKVPYVLGLIGTRSISEELPGIEELVKNAEGRIKNGLHAYTALMRLQQDPNDSDAKQQLKQHEHDLGYALLLKRQRDDINNATPADIRRAAEGTVPRVMPLFWAFRGMVACGFTFITLFAFAFYYSSRRQFDHKRFLRICFWCLPLPWVASELGWIVAEYGRQPWVITGILPTFLGVSSLTVRDVVTSLAGFITFYTGLLIIETLLMIKYIRLGPDGMAQQRALKGAVVEAQP